MRTIGHLSPVAWVMDGFHHVMWYGGGLAEIAPEIGILLGAAALFFANWRAQLSVWVNVGSALILFASDGASIGRVFVEDTILDL